MELRKKVFNSVIEFCEKIRFLRLNIIDSDDFTKLSKMIHKFNDSLKYLTIETKSTTAISSIILSELGKILPHSLFYLDLRLFLDSKYLQIFFEDCSQIELKRLLFKVSCYNKCKDCNLKIIKDFVKGKNIESLAYNITLDHNKVLCKNLENLIEEIQSFVRMDMHDDLVIKISNEDGSLMIK